MLRVVTAVISTALVLTACSADQQPVATARTTLNFGMGVGDLGTGDPQFAASSGDRILVDMIFNGLLRFKPGDSSIVEPDLAESVPDSVITGGKQVWTFTLRKGVQCQPGPKTPAYELTTDDVIYSLRKAADPKRSAYSADYQTMTFEKIDQYKMTITDSQLTSKTLFYAKVANYQGGFVLCSKAIEAVGDEAFKTNPVGTGPFTFKKYQPQAKIELVANDSYFRGKPRLAGVNLVFMPDDASREAGLRTGEIDAGLGVQDVQWVTKINATDGLAADVFGPAESYFINLNSTVKPLTDLRVRQAIAYAVDRDAHVALFGAPVAEKEFSVVPAQYLAGGLTEQEAVQRNVAYPHDVAKARQLMADAGYANGFTMTAVSSQVTFVRKNYELLQSELKAIGIDYQFTLVDHPTYHAQIRKDCCPITTYAAWRPNADLFLTQFFLSDSIVVTGKAPVTNFSHYDKIDALIKQARSETDAAKQAALWQDANTQMLKDMAVFPFMVLKQVFARSKKVDYGHSLKSVLALYPGIDELTVVNR